MSVNQRIAVIVTLGLVGGCQLGPDSGSMAPNGLVITTASSGTSNVLYAFDPVTGNVNAWPSLNGAVYGGALSADSRALFLNIMYSGFRSAVAAIDARSGNVLWSLPLSTAGQPGIIDGIGLLTGEVMGAGNDSLLYLWRSIKDSVVGIAAFDLKTRRPVAFSGPWNVATGGIQLSAQRCNAQTAVLIVLAGRQNASGGPRTDEAVYTLDAHTLAPLDSLLPPALGVSPGEHIWQALPSADGRTIYVATSARIVRYDACSRSVLASAPRPGTGLLAVVAAAAADTVLVLTDGGVWPDTPGSGLIYVFGRNLDLRDSIDVSTSVGGVPRSPTATVTGSAMGGMDGRTVYVRSGSDEVGPLYPPQRARLLIVDLQNRLVRAVDLAGFGLGLLFAPPN